MFGDFPIQNGAFCRLDKKCDYRKNRSVILNFFIDFDCYYPKDYKLKSENSIGRK